MKYNPELGIFGNLNLLFTERNKTNNNVFNNKSTADANHEESIEGLCEVAEITSDETDASTELAEMVAELYEAVAELGEIVAPKEV